MKLIKESLYRNMKNIFYLKKLKNERASFQIIGGVAVVNLLLAAAAFIKDVAFAAYMGTTREADAFLLAFFIPDTIGNNLLGAAIAVACVPVFSVLFEKKEIHRLKRSFSLITLISLVFTGLLMLFFYLYREFIIKNLGNGFPDEAMELCSQLLGIFLPSILLLPAAYIGNSALQVTGRFKTAAFTPVLYNLISLGGIIFAVLWAQEKHMGVFTIAQAVFLGFFFEFVYVLFYTQREGISFFYPGMYRNFFKPDKEEREDIRDIFRVFFPYLAILLSSQLVFLIERFLAAGLEAGTVSGLNYAFRLAQFPIWVFIAAISVVVLPSMSKSAGQNQSGSFEKTLGKAFEAVLIVALPLTLSFFILREPIVSVLLKRGAFDGHSAGLTAAILAGYSLTIVFQGISIICLRAFIAVQKMGIPLVVYLLSAGINIGADWILTPWIGSPGLGWGAAAGALFNAAFMLFFLKGRFPGVKLIYSGKLGGMLAANLLLALGLIFFRLFWPSFSQGYTAYGYGIVSGLVCIVIYVLGLRVCKAV